MAKNNKNNYENSLIPRTNRLSEKDLTALSKMSPEMGKTMPSNLVLCDVCGEPVAGSSKSSNSFIDEMIAGRHFSCHNRQINAKIAAAKAAGLASGEIPVWEDDNLSEDRRAEAYNNDQSSMTTVVAPAKVAESKSNKGYYVPPKGSIPLDRVKDAGGLSAFDPKNIPAPSNLPEQVQQMKEAAVTVDDEMRALYAKGDPGLIEQNVEDLFPPQT